METLTYRMRVFRHDNEGFRSLKNANILIYWPHGVGDFVFLGYILPLLEPTNRYWVTRFGDDMVSVMEGNELITPIYTGLVKANDGRNLGHRHFGLKYDELYSEEELLAVPLGLHKILVENRIDVLFWSGFPETYGHSSYPYHSKARNLIPHMVSQEMALSSQLNSPLRNTISLQVDPWLKRWVEGRLASFTGFQDRKLCLIGRNGHTNIDKNWGHRWREDMPEGKRIQGEECRDFMRLLLKKDKSWMFLSIEDRCFEGEHTLRSKELNAFTYADLFGYGDVSRLPFSLVMKALINIADLAVGVPAGMLFLCLLKKSLPTVGVWTAHLPSWYHEPGQSAIHVLSRNIIDSRLDQRPGSFESKYGLHFSQLNVDTRVIPGEQVLFAAEKLIG
jgi:hypothetical protein